MVLQLTGRILSNYSKFTKKNIVATVPSYSKFSQVLSNSPE
jgi:hypothetical protein